MLQATQAQRDFLESRLAALTGAVSTDFATLVPSALPEVAGVYLISALKNSEEKPYYVGRSKNLRRRLYTNHLMGSVSNARLKKYLIASCECADTREAKDFIRGNCRVRWIEQEGFRERAAVEGYIAAILFPKYGMYEEH